MHWWHSVFTSKSHSEDETDVVGDDAAGASRFVLHSFLWLDRFIARTRRLRHFSDHDVDICRGLQTHFQNSPRRSGPPSSNSASQPQPLPKPELRLLLQRDPKFNSSSSSCSVPLPSPDSIQGQRGCDEKERDREMTEAIDGPDGLKRSVGQDSRTSSEHPETRPPRKSLQTQNTKDKYSDCHSISVPNSAPTTPYSSKSVSPPKGDMLSAQYRIPPGVFQVRSAPETMPHLDGNLGQRFSYHMASEKTASSVDNSPFQSPSVASSPPRPPSPLTTKISPENHVPRRESTCQTTVHPLPLPPGPPMCSQPNPMSPGASMSSQSTPISSHTAKPEFPGANIPSHPPPISPGRSKPELAHTKSQWQKGKLIGRGTFGSVYVASNRETGALCAMKEVEILQDDSKSAECLRQLEQEIKVLSHLKHLNIVQYYGSEIVGDKFYIYLEYVYPGSINKFIHDHCGAMTESVVRNFTRHILCGLAYLHSTKTIHRDIKGANLLVDAHGVVKLADFGMAKHLNGQTANLSLKGSPYWMAPELLQSTMQTDASSDIALAVDIWSLGCTIIEMMNGKPPWSEYEGAAALFKVLKETPPIPETMSADGKDFLQCCFRRNPADRPTASKLLDHPFVSHSHHHDAFTQSLKGAKLMDNTQFLKEPPRHKLELPVPGTQMKKEKPNINESSQRSHLQTSHSSVVSLPTPHSILEALPILPMPSPEHYLDRNNTPSNIVPSSIKHAANI